MLEQLRLEIIGLLVQALVFLVGLTLSLVVGIYLGAQTLLPGSLLVVTVFAVAALLGAAALSQIARDRVVYGRI